MHQQHTAGRRVVQIVLAIGLFAGLALTASSPASAAPPAPTGLSPAAGSVSANPVFLWSAVRGAQGYDIQLASDPGFNAPILQAGISNHQFTPTTQLPMQKIYWRVRDAVNGITSRWSTTAVFTRAKLAGPTLVGPASGAVLIPPAQAPLLQWAPVNGAVVYHVQVDDAPDFLGAQTFTTATTSLLEPEPQDANTYYWRVTAELGSGYLTTVSATRSYVVGSLSTITGASPDVDANGNIPQIEQVVLSWNPLPGAVTYDIRVSTDVSFADNFIIDQRTVDGTRYSPPHTYAADDYYWQVRPRNTFGKATDWELVPKHRFTRLWSTLDNAATDTSGVPQLIYPADSVDPVLDDFYYQWTPTRLATRYRIDVGTDQNFSPTTFTSCFTSETTYIPGANGPQGTGCLPGVGQTLYWRVKALDGPGEEIQGIYSSIKSFVYTKNYITDVSPDEGATVTVPTLTWQAALDADRYQVRVTGPGFDNTYSTYSTSFTLPTQLTAGATYKWLVRSVDDLGRMSPMPVFGGYRSFVMSNSAPVGTGGAPLTPTSANTTTTRFPNLTWEPYPGAAYYQVYAGTAGSQFVTQVGGNWFYPAATDTSDTFLKPKNYRWTVAAYDSNNNQLGTNGPNGFFTISDLPAVAGQRVALDGSGLSGTGSATPCTRSLVGNPTNVCTGMTQTPVLDWDPVPGIGYYMVYLSRDPDFTNMVYGSYSDSGSIPTTTSTRWTTTETLPDSQAGAAYYWFIRPCKSPGNCSPDPLHAYNAFDKLSPTVQDPVESSSNGNDITFSWRDYLSTNQTTTDPLTGEHPGQAAQAYHVQVATSTAFNTILDDRTVDQRTYTAFDRLYPEGKLYWRVQAIDGSGRALPWSDVQSFTKSSPVPQLIAPTVTSDPATSTLTQTGPFRWSATNFAANYEVQVYKNNDTTASPANLVSLPNGNVKQAAGTFDRPFATGMIYAWRVRRIDISNNSGNWSDWGRFRVTGKAPTQTAPATKALVSSTSSLFKWSVVPGATSYRFERRVAGTSNDLDDFDTVSTAWAFTSPMGTGAYEWRVSSKDTVGQVIASSAWRPFHVDATAPTILKTGPQSPIGVASNLTIRFSETIRGASTKTIKLFKDGTHSPLPIKVITRGALVTINPKSNLKKGTVYDVVIKAGIKDTSGLPFQPTTYQVGTK